MNLLYIPHPIWDMGKVLLGNSLHHMAPHTDVETESNCLICIKVGSSNLFKITSVCLYHLSMQFWVHLTGGLKKSKNVTTTQQ